MRKDSVRVPSARRVCLERQDMKKTRHVCYYKSIWKWNGALMALPGIVLIVVFIIVPFLMNVGYAFTDYNTASDVPRFIGLTNFRNMAKDRDFWLVCTNTLKLILTYVIGGNVIAILLGVMITNVGRKFGNFVKTSIYFPQLLSMVVVGFLWRIMFSYNNGPINHFLEWIGVPPDLLPQWLGVPALIIPSISTALIWLISGYYSIIYHAGMMNIPMSYYEVSAIEGASKWQEFVHVTLPFLAPSITINTVLLTVESLSAFAVPASMTGGGGPGRYGTTLALWSYTTYFNNHQYGKAIAISVVLGLFAVVLAFIELKILLKKEVGNS